MTFVLYLNLWGTTAKLLGEGATTSAPPESNSRLFSPADLVACQSWFHETVSQRAPSSVEAFPLIDYAYAFSSDLSSLTAFAIEVFQNMVFPIGGEQIWPLRGAIAEGAERHPQYRPMAWLGPGTVKAAELEKSAQKGMRLLIERNARSYLNTEAPVRPIAVRGHQHFEVNWLPAASLSDPLAEARLQQLSTNLMEIGTNYSQQLGASLNDLVRWMKSEKRDEMNDAHDGR